MASSNPILNTKRFAKKHVAGGVMGIDGTINKALILLVLVILGAAGTWWLASTGDTGAGIAIIIAIVGVFVGLGIAIALAFKPEWSPYLAPVYGIVEGAALGAISMFIEQAYPGIVLQAIALTFGIALGMLVLYRTGVIKVTRGFWIGVMIATAGVILTSVVVWILSLFGVTGPMNALYGNGPIGIIFSLIVIIIATMNLLVDFAFIDEASKQGYPRYFEWYAAFGLMVTLVWLYIEILRLLVKLRSRD